MSILAHQKTKAPEAGYAGDFVTVAQHLAPELKRSDWKLITNAGGANPAACVAAIARVWSDAVFDKMLLACVDGDDVLPRLAALQAEGWEFPHLDTGEPLGDRAVRTVNACAYLGSPPIVESLAAGARVIVTGRVADAALALAPAMDRYGWARDDWDRLAGGAVAGHLIECGAQVTGAYSTNWKGRCLSDVGYPIAEVDAQGDCVITKPADSGGVVDRQSVAEQLIYEIGDPRHYLTPDVDVDFTNVQLEQQGRDRVAVRGARGGPAPEHWKVSLAFRNGYTASAMLVVAGDDCVSKAQACAEIVWSRLRRAGWELQRKHVELLGAGQSAPWRDVEHPVEVVLRLSVADPRREAVERFTKEIAPLITSGPAGLGGYASGRSRARPLFAFWPTTLPKTALQPRVQVRTVSQWRTWTGASS